MEIISASNARQKIFGLLASTSIGEPVLITSNAGNCVLVSEEEWNSIQETNYLMSNPKTREDIINGIHTPISECQDKLLW